MKNPIKKAIVISSLAAVISICGVYAVISDEISIEGEGSLSHVSVSIEQLMTDDNGNDVSYQSPAVVYPGTKINQKIKIQNTGKPCYLRFSIEGNSADSLDISNINEFDNSKWSQKGDYYYLTSQLNEDESIVLYDGLTIPSTLTNDSSGQDIGFKLKIDVIQSENFEQDLDSDSPWGNVEIKPYTSNVSL